MRWISSFIFVCFALNLSAEDYLSPAENLQSRIENLGSFSASFAQTTYEQDGYLLDEQEGRLFFSRPSRLRWEADAPFEQTLVADGQSIYLYDPDLNQVTIRAWSQDPMQNPAAIFVSGEELSSFFSVSMDGEQFTLTPSAEDSSIRQMQISFDGGSPVSMVIDDALGQRTKIEFVDQEIGVLLEPSMFVFTIPDGAEVITDG